MPYVRLLKKNFIHPQVDPVMCSNGKVYCRFSVLQLISSGRAPTSNGKTLDVCGDDALLRVALFAAYPQQRSACEQARQAYAASMNAARKSGSIGEASRIARCSVQMLLCAGNSSAAAQMQSKLKLLECKSVEAGSTMESADFQPNTEIIASVGNTRLPSQPPRNSSTWQPKSSWQPLPSLQPAPAEPAMQCAFPSTSADEDVPPSTTQRAPQRRYIPPAAAGKRASDGTTLIKRMACWVLSNPEVPS